MIRCLIALSLTVFCSGLAVAKPLLTDSQDTFASACIADEDTPERMILICEKALEQSGASAAQRAEMMVSLAWAFYDLGQFDRADAVFAKALDLYPASAAALRGHGWLAHDRRDYARAADYFRQSVAIEPNARGLSGLGSSLVRDGQAGLGEGLQILDAALALDPDYAWALREQGWLLIDDRRYEAALEKFQRAVSRDPDDPYAHYGACFALTELDRWEEALEHANRALDLEPDYVAAVSRRSLILLKLERSKQSLKDADTVIAAWPDSSSGYVRKARALRALGRGQEALALLEDADERLEPDSYLIYWRANFLLEDGRAEEALAQIYRSLGIDDTDHFDHTLKTRIALQIGEVAVARRSIDAALRLYPDGEWPFFYDALVMVAEDRFDEAEARFDMAVEAGLPDSKLEEFLKALVGKSQFLQAVQMRVRYSDLEKAAASP